MNPTLTEAAPVDIEAAECRLIEAARRHAARMKITPRWQERLTPEARALVEAVDAYDQAEVAR